MFSSRPKDWWKSLLGFVRIPFAAGWKAKMARMARTPKVNRLISFARRLVSKVRIEGEFLSEISDSSDVGIAEYGEGMI